MTRTSLARIFPLTRVNEAGEEVRRSPIHPDTAHAPSMDEMLTRIWPIIPSTVLMRRTAFDRSGGFGEHLSGPEDIHFSLIMREQGHFIYLPERLVRFTFGQLYPKVLNRHGGHGAMIEEIRARYGARADRLVAELAVIVSRRSDILGCTELRRGMVEAVTHGRNDSTGSGAKEEGIQTVVAQFDWS